MNLSLVSGSLIKLYTRSSYKNNAWFVFDKTPGKIVLCGMLC